MRRGWEQSCGHGGGRGDGLSARAALLGREAFHLRSGSGGSRVEVEVEAETEKRGKFFSMDTSFTTCRDDANLHECTTKINKNGEKKSVTVSHQCCYGHQRSEPVYYFH